MTIGMYFFSIFYLLDSIFLHISDPLIETISFYISLYAFINLVVIVLLLYKCKINLFEKISSKRIENLSNIEIYIYLFIIITAIIVAVCDRLFSTIKLGIDISNGVAILMGISSLYWAIYLYVPSGKK